MKQKQTSKMLNIKKLFRNLALKFFKGYIRVYHDNKFISDAEVQRVAFHYPQHIRHEMAINLIERILEDGRIEFEETEDKKAMGRFVRAKIRII